MMAGRTETHKHDKHKETITTQLQRTQHTHSLTHTGNCIQQKATRDSSNTNRRKKKTKTSPTHSCSTLEHCYPPALFPRGTVLQAPINPLETAYWTVSTAELSLPPTVPFLGFPSDLQNAKRDHGLGIRARAGQASELAGERESVRESEGDALRRCHGVTLRTRCDRLIL